MKLHTCTSCSRPFKRSHDRQRECPSCERPRTGAWAGGSTRSWREQRKRILERDHHVCQVRLVCAGAPATHVDHIVPKSRGGTDDDSNLRAACADCNLKRGNR